MKKLNLKIVDRWRLIKKKSSFLLILNERDSRRRLDPPLNIIRQSGVLFLLTCGFIFSVRSLIIIGWRSQSVSAACHVWIMSQLNKKPLTPTVPSSSRIPHYFPKNAYFLSTRGIFLLLKKKKKLSRQIPCMV